jgi:hypothetical protein
MRSLRYIARINKQLLPASAEDTLRNVAEQSKGAVHGPASFMSSARLATNTALLIVCWYGEISTDPIWEWPISNIRQPEFPWFASVFLQEWRNIIFNEAMNVSFEILIHPSLINIYRNNRAHQIFALVISS